MNTTITIGENQLDFYKYNTVIVGSGAAGFNAALRLHTYGQKDIALITDHLLAGTSRNTGSDKQTYYKLTLAGDKGDSVYEMAQTLFQGGCVDGDIALTEASLSAQSFLHLVELGVPFPRNQYGEFVGYKTDHDPRARGTSIGPYTSKVMTECLETACREKNIELLSGYQVIKVLKDKGKVLGLLCYNLKSTGTRPKFSVFSCKNVVYATGGPAGIYANTVYPHGHYGASGVALQAGIKGKNLTEWQFGLASVKPKWNVSGTYMQALPKFISTNQDGSDEIEFLPEYFDDKYKMLSLVFLKGYQWPFDVNKIENGSSLIDLLVYNEINIRNRRVFLDYRENPMNMDIDFELLDKEAYSYLKNTGATFGKPIDRLMAMNQPAVNFYKDKGVDLSTTPLEVSLCAQHNNGGLGVDNWWQTNLEGFFAVGEVACTHGVYRPGGSALNSGQVGSTRAALYISEHREGEPEPYDEWSLDVIDEIKAEIELPNKILGGTDTLKTVWSDVTRQMTDCGGMIRDINSIGKAIEKVKNIILNFDEVVKISELKNLSRVYRLKDIVIAQYVYLSAMEDYIKMGGHSRGSALYSNPDGKLPHKALGDIFKYILDSGQKSDMVQEIKLDYKILQNEISWRKVRGIPRPDYTFENVWRSYRENRNIV